MTTTPAPATQATAKPLTAPLSAALGALYDVDGERLLALALDDLDRHADTIRKATNHE